jgi:hypothetical protein
MSSTAPAASTSPAAAPAPERDALHHHRLLGGGEVTHVPLSPRVLGGCDQQKLSWVHWKSAQCRSTQATSPRWTSVLQEDMGQVQTAGL